ncbi:MAG: hypothetical protein EBZ47_09125, partial [Chlamydiae bacterium]|nr:hypothetical protein [Chlamydiota bacterium]
KILKYSELANYGNLDELLPDPKDYKVILTESKRNQGHWCCLLKYPTKEGCVYEWFDSYSGMPDSELKFIPASVRRMLGESKHHLILENQLIYAVIQLEREGGEIKLQCRWLDDLTKVDGAMIMECDTAYDKAKMQVKLAEMREKNPKTKTEGKPLEKNKEALKLPSHLYLKIDMDVVRLSHIIFIKELFRTDSGAIPIQIEFFSEDYSLGSIKIQENWGVKFSEDLIEKLLKIISVKAASYNT